MDPSKINTPNAVKNRLLFQLKILSDYCDRAEQLSEQDVKLFKKALPDIIGILPIEFKKWKNPPINLTTERLVINTDIHGANKRLKSLENLRYPPRKIAHTLTYNRASLKGQSMFYASSGGGLRVSIETQPVKGQLVTMSHWQLKKDQTLNLFIVCQDKEIALKNPDELCDFYNQYLEMLGQLQDNTREVVKAFYRFVVKAFTREVNPNNKQGYLFSALLTDLIFKHEPQIDAIYYPSIPNNGSAMNIAVKPNVLDKKFEMVEASEFVMMQSPNPDSSGWYSAKTATCKQYDQNSLTLNWEDYFSPPHDPVHQIMKDYKIDLT